MWNYLSGYLFIYYLFFYFCHFLYPGDLPDPGIGPASPALQEDSLPLNNRESPIKEK